MTPDGPASENDDLNQPEEPTHSLEGEEKGPEPSSLERRSIDTRSFYIQSGAVLVSAIPSLADVVACLGDWPVIGKSDASSDWTVRGEAVRVEFEPELRGFIEVDIMARPWPDDCGESSSDRRLFRAWGAGMLGPAVYPGALQRAMEQSWRWPDGRVVPAEHQAVLRLRLGYQPLATSAGEQLQRPTTDPVVELEALTRLAQRLLDLPGAICWFNPNGEAVLDQASLLQTTRFSDSRNIPPLDAWCNLRVFSLPDGRTMMDTVGHAQLGLPDLEAWFDGAKTPPADIDQFLRDVSVYLLEHGSVIDDDDLLDGPGPVRWRAELAVASQCGPRRSVLRLTPEVVTEAPSSTDFGRSE